MQFKKTISDIWERVMPDPNKLSAVEAAELQECVELVRQGIAAWDRAGEALERIRTKQLYRQHHRTFETFACETFQLTRRRLDQLIESWRILRGLRDEKLVADSTKLPESAIRPLAGLSSAQAAEVWSEVTGGAADTVPASRAVRTAAARRKPAKKRDRQRPIVFRVPGGTVAVHPNKAFTSAEQLLLAALEQVRSKAAAA